MSEQTAAPRLSLYEQDETAWLEQTARLVAERRLDEIDHDHLSEYLADMARRDKREVLSRLIVLIAHLLKWGRQPDQRSKSWRGTIFLQRGELTDLLESGTLRRYATEVLAKSYRRAVEQAVVETGLAEDHFPRECPWSLDEVLTLDQGV